MVQSPAQVGESLSTQGSAHYQPLPVPSSIYGKEKIDNVTIAVHMNVNS